MKRVRLTRQQTIVVVQAISLAANNFNWKDSPPLLDEVVRLVHERTGVQITAHNARAILLDLSIVWRKPDTKRARNPYVARPTKKATKPAMIHLLNVVSILCKEVLDEDSEQSRKALAALYEAARILYPDDERGEPELVAPPATIMRERRSPSLFDITNIETGAQR